MYRVLLDGSDYYYETLEQACFRICQYMDIFSLLDHLKTGIFERTSFANQPAVKIKKYTIKTSTAPPITIELLKQEKEQLEPELVFYYFDLWKEKNARKYNRFKK